MPVNPSSPRGRGRPPKSGEQQERLRRRVLAATAATYAEFGFRGSTVARIAERAEISKPTFYTCYPSVEAAVEAVVADASAHLLTHLRPAITPDGDLLGVLGAGIDAYLDWAENVGDGLRVFHAEQHDPGSPAGRLRARSTAWVREVVRDAVVGSGRPAPSPQALDLLIGGLQLACHEYQRGPRHERPACRAAMLRLALGLLGTPRDWHAAADALAAADNTADTTGGDNAAKK